MFMTLLLTASPAVADVQAARADLLQAARARKNLTTMTANYVQERSSLLSKRPLTTQGKLYYRANPPTVALQVEQPRRLTIRLSPHRYEVYRPGKNTLERFTLQSSSWTSLLGKTMSAQVAQLEQHFTIVSSQLSEKPLATRTISFAPHDKSLKARLKAMTLVIDHKHYLLRRVSFTELSGDRISFKLSEHRLNPKLSAKTFTIKTDSKTRIITHNSTKK